MFKKILSEATGDAYYLDEKTRIGKYIADLEIVVTNPKTDLSKRIDASNYTKAELTKTIIVYSSAGYETRLFEVIA